MNHAFYEYSQSCIRQFEDVDVNALDDDTLFDEPEKPPSSTSSRTNRINHFSFKMGTSTKEESIKETDG